MKKVTVIEKLPLDMWVNICLFLKIFDLIRLAKTNREFRSLLQPDEKSEKLSAEEIQQVWLTHFSLHLLKNSPIIGEVPQNPRLLVKDMYCRFSLAKKKSNSLFSCTEAELKDLLGPYQNTPEGKFILSNVDNDYLAKLTRVDKLLIMLAELKDEIAIQNKGKQRLIKMWKEEGCQASDRCSRCVQADIKIVGFFLDKQEIGEDTITPEQIEKFLKEASNDTGFVAGIHKDFGIETGTDRIIHREIDNFIKKLIQYKAHSGNPNLDIFKLLLIIDPLRNESHQFRLLKIINHNSDDFFIAYFKQILFQYLDAPLTKLVIHQLKYLNTLNETNQASLNEIIARANSESKKNETDTNICRLM